MEDQSGSRDDVDHHDKSRYDDEHDVENANRKHGGPLDFYFIFLNKMNRETMDGMKTRTLSLGKRVEQDTTNMESFPEGEKRDDNINFVKAKEKGLKNLGRLLKQKEKEKYIGKCIEMISMCVDRLKHIRNDKDIDAFMDRDIESILSMDSVRLPESVELMADNPMCTRCNSSHSYFEVVSPSEEGGSGDKGRDNRNRICMDGYEPCRCGNKINICMDCMKTYLRSRSVWSGTKKCTFGCPVCSKGLLCVFLLRYNNVVSPIAITGGGNIQKNNNNKDGKTEQDRINHNPQDGLRKSNSESKSDDDISKLSLVDITGKYILSEEQWADILSRQLGLDKEEDVSCRRNEYSSNGFQMNSNSNLDPSDATMSTHQGNIPSIESSVNTVISNQRYIMHTLEELKKSIDFSNMERDHTGMMLHRQQQQQQHVNQYQQRHQQQHQMQRHSIHTMNNDNNNSSANTMHPYAIDAPLHVKKEKTLKRDSAQIHTNIYGSHSIPPPLISEPEDVKPLNLSPNKKNNQQVNSDVNLLIGLCNGNVNNNNNNNSNNADDTGTSLMNIKDEDSIHKPKKRQRINPRCSTCHNTGHYYPKCPLMVPRKNGSNAKNVVNLIDNVNITHTNTNSNINGIRSYMSPYPINTSNSIYLQ